MPFDDSPKAIFATLLVASITPIPVYLLWMHGLQRLWRRLGWLSYILHISLYVVMVTALIRMHGFWSRWAWPWPDAVAWLCVVPFAIALWLLFESYRTIDWRTMHQVRQLVPGQERPLVRDGILGRMRHPRYVAFLLVAIGNFVMTGYPLLLLCAVITFAGLALVVRIEERELRAFFGEEFEKYRREVGAFWPR
jgi:protein-S-isoprenylcysteine O-methyltransferase Ste14